MPKALQKTLLKLGIAGCLALLLFNYHLLSLYRGDVLGVPTLYVMLFGLWLALIIVARGIAEPGFGHISKLQRRQSEQITHD